MHHLTALLLIVCVCQTFGFRQLSQAIPPVENVSGRLVCSGSSFAGIASNGSLYYWGNSPVQGITAGPLPVLADAGPWQEVGVSYGFTCAIRASDSKAYCASVETNGTLVPISDTLTFKTISVGYGYMCGITTQNSSLYCYGKNDQGQLGTGNTDTPKTPQLVVVTNSSSPWATVGTNTGHTCATKVDGTGYCFGSNFANAISPSNVTSLPSPVQIPGTWKSLVPGSRYTLGIATNGTGFAWGLSENFDTDFSSGGQLGTGQQLCYDTVTKNFCPGIDFDPVQKVQSNILPIAGDHLWSQLSTNGQSYGIEQGTGKLYGWGYANGEAAAPGVPNSNSPVEISPGSKWLSVSGGPATCGIKPDGTGWAWGIISFNCDGDCYLGDGTSSNSGVPVKIAGIDSFLADPINVAPTQAPTQAPAPEPAAVSPAPPIVSPAPGPSVIINSAPPPPAASSAMTIMSLSNFTHEPGNVFSAATLIAGTAVGAGILALPAICQPAGFAASAVAITGAAGYSMFTACLIAEVAINTMCELGTGGVSLNSMSKLTLGNTGASLTSILYALLHYSLLVAYIAKAGETINIASDFPLILCDVAFACIIGFMCYIASPSVLDSANTVLVGGVILSFFCLLVLTGSDIHTASLVQANWESLPPALPVIALAFVFQNVVPVVCSSLEGDRVKIRTAIVAGCSLPWAMFLLWNACILGGLDPSSPIDNAVESSSPSSDLNIEMQGSHSMNTYNVPTTTTYAPPLTTTAPSSLSSSPIDTTQHSSTRNTAAVASASMKKKNISIDPLAVIRASGPIATTLVDGFSLLAITTSFIGFVLGLTEFIAEIMNKPVGREKQWPFILTVVPPLVLAINFPDVFYKALSLAGTYGVLTLFGLIPCAMVWNLRYSKESTALSTLRVAPGERGVLIVAGIVALVIIIEQVLS